MSFTCPKCGATEGRWVTVGQEVFVDVLQCAACSTKVVEEDWMAPLGALRPGGCMNCCDVRERGRCPSCGLSDHEDSTVHTELRDLVHPSLSLLDAAVQANKAGRRLMALKLATAAAATDEGGRGDSARAMRVWLLSALGVKERALDDAKAWIEQWGDPTAVAWASYGQQLQHNAFPGAAADAYHKSLEKDPNQVVVRATRAALLFQLGREGQSLHETVRVFESPQLDKNSLTIAIQTAEKLAELFSGQGRADEVKRLLEKVGDHARRSAVLTGHLAWVAAVEGDLNEARHLLERAQQAQPNLAIYDRVVASMKQAAGKKTGKSSWWRW